MRMGNDNGRDMRRADGFYQRIEMDIIVGTGIKHDHVITTDEIGACSREGKRPAIRGDKPAHQGANRNSRAMWPDI